MALPDIFTRAATIEPTTANDETRTVRVVWSTGASVTRRDASGPFEEVLSLDAAHVRLDHLRGASVLDSHRGADLSSVLGVVEQAGVEAGEGWADLRFSSRAEVAPIWQDVREGIIKSVSIGYSVARWLDGKSPATGNRTRTAVDWSPREISLVPLGADAGARIRSTDVEAENEATGDDRAEINAQIRTITRAGDLGSDFADALIDRGAGVLEARAAAFEELTSRGGGSIRTQRVEMGYSSENPATRNAHMAEALHSRIRPGVAPSEAARPYMNMSLADMAGVMLRARGDRGTGLLSRDELLTRAMHTLSDFPGLLTATGNRTLLSAYQAAPNPLKMLARQSTLPDFRAKTLLRIGEMPKLQSVTESGEIKSVSRAESNEGGYSLNTFGSIFSLSRKAFVNDDLFAFADWATAMGRAAAETEADQLVSLLTSNPIMGDGATLFHGTHGNVGTPAAAPSVATFSALRLAMRTQKGVDGTTPINATPAYVLLPPSLETSVDQVLSAIYAAKTTDVNPFSGRLTPLVEPRLSGTAWYAFADPAVLPCLEYSYLASATGPQIVTRQGWEVLGAEFRVTLDFGCGPIDWRGAWRNAGA